MIHLALSPGVIHRMEAIEDCIYLEASTPEIDDVVRLSDDYDRENQDFSEYLFLIVKIHIMFPKLFS